MGNTTKLIILDRDGVINHDCPDYIKTPDEWVPIDGSITAIAQLHHAGWRIVIASNQSALGRGLLTVETLYAIHLKMQGELAGLGAQVGGLFFCPHTPQMRCACRKPKTGLLEQIARRFNLDWHETPFVGDTLKDIKAARVVGARPILTLTGQGQKTKDTATSLANVAVYPDLAAVADALVNDAADTVV